MTAEGCAVEPIALDAARALAEFALFGGAEAETRGANWLLGFFWDGVLWGKRHGQGWRLASSVLPGAAPVPRRHALLELRLFGPDCEALLWRQNGQLAGRWLRNAPHAVDREWLRPARGAYITHGDAVISKAGGFTEVADSAGMRQVLPLELEDADLKRGRPELQFVQYFACDGESGLVQPATARLTDLAWNSRSQ